MLPNTRFELMHLNPSFKKDGRKIRIGDCALFKPPQDSPAFIGIIRRLISGEAENLKLSVNWIYRPADVKLEKGALVEAAPNEVFYSFHKDEILAASLLHPCKVTFLRKGVELPLGISSFLCRRVYDVENKRLWWLTDQDYIDERQEEVDQLLQKTQLDMYGALQSGGRSPKGLNGTTGNTQLRSSSESAQNINPHLPPQIKIKKRDRVDQGSDPVKRERLSKADDSGSGEFRTEQVLKSDIAKITDSGRLVDYEGVEKLVQLMQPESVDKKIDLACRMILVDVIAVTDKFDCLGWFVQLKGLPVLDRWLQEVHKGKNGDGSSPKESDKLIDEFLLILLRALEKLPVNLHELQTCNIGKSVNHLRSHKNSEIQKKARSLVDTWKKRVEAEMNVLETKSGSMGNQPSRGQSEVSGKSSSAQSSGKMPHPKFGSSDTVAKVVATSPSSTKPIACNTKDTNSVAVTGSDPLSTIKEEKSSSSSHSRNNSQSYSSDHVKIASSCREEARSSTAGSIGGVKISGPSSRHRKSSYNLQGSALSGVQKEVGLGKVSLKKHVGSEKVQPLGGTHERVSELSVPNQGNSQRLIVRLPNTGRSPARSSNGGPCEDPIALSKNSPLARSVKSDPHDTEVKEKSDALRFSTLSKGDRENRRVLVRSNEGNLSPPTAISNNMKHCVDDKEKVTETLKGSCLSSGYKPTEGDSYDASFKSMNALVESCVKFSEAGASVSGGDDMGMNLLATVAAGETSRSDGSPPVSHGRNLPAPQESCSGNDVNSRHIDEDTARSEDLGSNRRATLVQGNPADLHVKDESSRDAMRTLVDMSTDNRASMDASVGISSEDAIIKDIVKKVGSTEFNDGGTTDKNMDTNCINVKNKDSSLKLPEVSTSKPVMEEAKESPSFSSAELCPEGKSDLLCKGSGRGTSNEQKLPITDKTHQDSKVSKNEASALPSISVSVLSLEMEKEKEKIIDTNADTQIKQSEKQIESLPMTVPNESQNPVVKEDKNDHDGCPDKSSSEEHTTVITQTTNKLNGDDVGGPETVVKLDFDLNEGFDVDDGFEEQIVKSPVCGSTSREQLPCSLPLPISSMSGSFPASVTVASAAKGPFYPPENSFRGKGELGWKGSAATSAFRPAEPRKTLDSMNASPLVDCTVHKQGRPFLDFDLNVADERDLEDDTTCGGLDLDLNRVDESHEVRKKSPHEGISQASNKPSLSSGFANADLNSSRDFDLNSGPSPDDVLLDTATRAQTNVPFLSSIPGVRMSSTDQASLASWFPQGNSYSPIAITPILPNREGQGYPVVSASGAQRIIGHPAGITAFGPEYYRGQVLSSSPALAFPNNVPFQYPFPFETSFPMPPHAYPNTSTAYPSIPSQLVGPSGVVSSHYPRAYMMNIPGGAAVDSRRWVGQALDLNNGPGNAEQDRRDERLTSALRHAPVPVSQPFSAVSADDQMRMYQMAGGSLKRKDPDSGQDGDRTNYKQLPPWQ